MPEKISRYQEKLREVPGQMVAGLTTSPGGKECVGMTFDRKEWILYASKRAPLASKIVNELNVRNIEAIPGAPFNLAESIESGKLALHKEDGVLGVFVSAEKFDDLLDGKLLHE